MSNHLDETELDLLLFSSDPDGGGQDPEGLAASRERSAGIPLDGGVVYTNAPPVHTLSSVRGVKAPSRWRSRAVIGLAVAAAAVIVAGAGVLQPWNRATGPAAPPVLENQGVPPADGHITDQQALEAISTSGTTQITGRLRQVGADDPARVKSTGWVISPSLFSETTEGTPAVPIQKTDSWIPVDLRGFDTGLLQDGGAWGIIATVAGTIDDDQLVIPVPGEFGVLISDERSLAGAPIDDALTLRTLQGRAISIPDGFIAGAPLLQFGAFDLAVPRAKPATVPVTSLRVDTVSTNLDPSGRACIAVSGSEGTRILAFPAGARAVPQLGDDLTVSPQKLGMKVILEPSATQTMESAIVVGEFTPGPFKDGEMVVRDTESRGTCGSVSGLVSEYEG